MESMPPIKKKELIDHYRFKSCPDYTKRSSIPPTIDRIPIHAWIVRSNTSRGTRPRDGARLNGKMAEWLNAPVLKTGNCNRFWGSNPCLSAKDVHSPSRDQGAQSRPFTKADYTCSNCGTVPSHCTLLPFSITVVRQFLVLLVVVRIHEGQHL